MRINFLNLPKDHIGLPKRLGLEFKIGEILNAKVLKINAEKALLQLKGQKVLADVKTNLQPGDAIKVRVMGDFKNQVVLKVINEQISTSTQAEQLLKQAGVTPSPESRAALAFLLKNGLPVTSGTLQTAMTDQTTTLDQILTKIFLPKEETTTQQNPPNQANTSTNSTLEGFNHDKEELISLLKNTLNRNENTPKAQSLPEKLPIHQNSTPATQQKSEKQSGQSTLPAQHHPDTQKSAQPSSITKEQFTITSKIATSIQESTTLLKETTDQHNTETLLNTTDKHSTSTDKQLNTPNATKNTLTLTKAEGTPTNTKMPNFTTLNNLEQKGLLLNPARNLPELIRGLKQLVQTLGLTRNLETQPTNQHTKSNLSSLFSTPLNESQTEGMRELSDKVIAMKLHHKEPGVLLHMEIPMIFNQQLQTGILHIREEEEHRELAQKDRPLSILFRLKTEDLGQLRVLVLLRDQEVNCHFSAEREETRMLLRKTTPDLKERFESLAYKVNHIGILPLNEEEEESTNTLPGQVDFRV